MLDPFATPTDLDQLRSRYEVLRTIRRSEAASLYAVRTRDKARHYLVNIVPAEGVGRARAGALQVWHAHTVLPLEHPKLMAIHAIHHLQDGAVAVAIDRRRGRTLAEVLRDGAHLPTEEAERIFRDVAEAVRYLHGRGVVHRSVRPDAIFLDRDAGHARLAPFPVEPLEHPSPAEAAHLAPELVARSGRYEDRKASHRSDIYALGVVGHRMLVSGREEHVARGADDRLDRGAFVSLADLRPDVPAALADAIERCLAPRPRQRWKEVDQLLAVLDEAHEAVPVARPPRRLVSYARSLRFRPTLGALRPRSVNRGAAKSVAFAVSGVVITVPAIALLAAYYPERPGDAAGEEVRLETSAVGFVRPPERAGAGASTPQTVEERSAENQAGPAAEAAAGAQPAPAPRPSPRESRVPRRVEPEPAATRVVLLGDPIDG